jgi:protein SCO1/2
VPLIDQDGKELRLYDDLIKDKVVIINSMFTSCNSVCPPMTMNLQRIQDWLGDRLGKEVVILSFSVDPATDTPQTLKAFANKYNARPGWHFLTCKKENLDFAIRKLGLYVDTREDHYTVMLIGNDRTNLWKKALGMARADALIDIVESVLKDQPGKAQ